jgi:hypothetical protein
MSLVSIVTYCGLDEWSSVSIVTIMPRSAAGPIQPPI